MICPRIVLIIDDNIDIRECLQTFFEEEGFIVYVATHGREGIEVLQRIEGSCLILLDLNMPVMNGREFLEKKRKLRLAHNSPVLVFSATRTRHNETIEGISEWINKPVDLNDFIDIVERYCGNGFIEDKQIDA
ncbi:response regulator [Nitrosomonas supralitoralis]|uniref:response regulator n=1 Tax=Nitrosomonas supralitoralis TaxID=2116706 RepID=UPI0015587A03|nr:response regulator [Nitrosomonas supralitoralis]